MTHRDYSAELPSFRVPAAASWLMLLQHLLKKRGAGRCLGQGPQHVVLTQHAAVNIIAALAAMVMRRWQIHNRAHLFDKKCHPPRVASPGALRCQPPLAPPSHAGAGWLPPAAAAADGASDVQNAVVYQGVLTHCGSSAPQHHKQCRRPAPRSCAAGAVGEPRDGFTALLHGARPRSTFLLPGIIFCFRRLGFRMRSRTGFRQ